MKKINLTLCALMVSVFVASGCAKDNVSNNSDTTQSLNETQVQEVGTTAEVVAETASEAKSNEAVTLSSEEVVLVNPFMTYTAQFDDNSQLMATSGIAFDEGVELEVYQLSLVEIGNMSVDAKYLKHSDFFDAGIVGEDGETEFVQGSGGWMEAYSKDLNIELYDREESPYVYKFYVQKNINNSGQSDAKVPVKITQFGLEIGQSAEKLKQLGTPSYTMLYNGKYYYYWQVGSEGEGCCIEVTVDNNVIDGLGIQAF